MNEKPTLFKCVILPYLLESITAPVLAFLILYCLGANMIIPWQLYLVVFIVSFIAYSMHIDMFWERYEKKLHDHKYHQITWDEYVQMQEDKKCI